MHTESQTGEARTHCPHFFSGFRTFKTKEKSFKTWDQIQSIGIQTDTNKKEKIEICGKKKTITVTVTVTVLSRSHRDFKRLRSKESNGSGSVKPIDRLWSIFGECEIYVSVSFGSKHLYVLC